MNDIKKAFENGKALIPFITAGDPDLAVTKQLLIEMSKNGADIIAIGIPFSDPIAEGVAIQEADLRALSAGTTTDKIFEMIKSIRQQIECELAVMSYMNPVFVYGVDKFMAKCAECGISAVIVPDTPYEEKAELSGACDANHVALISLIAPTSEDRIRMIAKDAQGFLFCIPSLGVAGVKSDTTAQDIERMVGMVRSVSDIPCAIGFGVADEEQAKLSAQTADGMIIGSEVVEIIGKYGKNCVEPVITYLKDLKEAMK